MAKKRASLGCLFWVALILLVLVIILFNYKQINRVLENTGMDKYINNLLNKSGRTAASEEPEPVRQQENEPVSPPVQRESQGEPARDEPPQPEVQPPPEEIAIAQEPPQPSRPPQDINIRNANIYYIRLEDNGEIDYIGVKRKVKYTDSPLTSTLEALMQGPTLQEANIGLKNLIPAESRLKNIYVRENTAYLDFNENFRFNIGAKEGMIAQLKQIIYTSTEFINVGNVQFLIEGEIVDYLGPEGVFIGRPLGREDL